MRGELKALTPEGERFVELAEEHAADFATRAAQHDREGSFPFENFDAMKKSGFIAGFVPRESGGLGLASVHDMAVGMSRLARGDASTAIAVNMHLATSWTMERMRSREPDAPLGKGIAGMQGAIARGEMIAAVFGTEAGTTVAYPNTEIVRDGDTYLLRGRKIFGTLSPVATMYFSPSRIKGEDGQWRGAVAMLGKGLPGVDIKDNWEAMGMRASGSGDVDYNDVRLTSFNVLGGDEPLGQETPIGLEMGIGGQTGLIACFMGIAEEATRLVVESATKRRKGPSNALMAERQWMQHLIGEMQIELEVCRSMVDRIGILADEAAKSPYGEGSFEDLLELNRQFQAAKFTTNRLAINVVDKALTASGGAGYMSAHPLSRLYRDVRAGPFMQPFSPPEAIEYIGRVALGQDPKVE